jgi:CDGSH-type Zn-finger protein/mannose-6-phosphate isomerase-like protein (cupin superfamily)
MPDPLVAKQGPYFVELKAGRTYFWCACGRSARQPFCDGSHAGTGFTPMKFIAREDREAVLCGCKHTRAGPFCDGTHNNLSATYKEADEQEILASASLPITPRDAGDLGKAVLDGGCYVVTVDRTTLARHGAMRIAPVIHGTDGAKFLSQFYAEVDGGVSDILQFPDSAAVLFIRSGAGALTISGRSFAVGPETAAHIRPGEGFSIRNSGPERMEVLITVCPQVEGPQWLERMSAQFDESLPRRVAGVDLSRREPMADRFYQVLIGEERDDTQVTEFIGELPCSRAAAHRHLYEEAIMILCGEGFLWTQGARATVQPGDIIFLPRKQIHSLECTSAGGMRLMGVFYPAGSPAVNY